MGVTSNALRRHREQTSRSRDRVAAAKTQQQRRTTRGASSSSGTKRRPSTAAAAGADGSRRQRRPLPSSTALATLIASAADACRVPAAAADLSAVLDAVRRQDDCLATTLPATKRAPRTEQEPERAGRGEPPLTPDTIEALVGTLVAQLPSLVVDETAVKVLGSVAALATCDSSSDSRIAAQGTHLIDAVLQLLPASVDGDAESDADEDDTNGSKKPRGHRKQILAPRMESAEAEGEEFATNPLSALGLKQLVDLATHPVARAVVWACIEHGTTEQKRALHRAITPYALTLATERHGSHAVLMLHRHYPRSRKALDGALLPIVGDTLLPDPVGAKVAQALVNPMTAPSLTRTALLCSGDAEDDQARSPLAAAIAQEAAHGKRAALAGADKRVMRYATVVLRDGLTFRPAAANAEGEEATPVLEAAQEEERVQALCDLTAAVLPRAVGLACDPQGNFLIQALLAAHQSWASTDVPSSLLPSATKKSLAGALQQLLAAFTNSNSPTLADMAAHPNAAHVLGALAACGPAGSKAVAAALRPSLVSLACSKHGSIALRRLVQRTAEETRPAIADALLQAVGQHVSTLLEDAYGNLVIPVLLQALPASQRTSFFAKHMKADLVTWCKHPYGSRVVYSLLASPSAAASSANTDSDQVLAPLDVKGMNDAFGALKHHLVPLAQHLNGRFIVESVLAPHREAQQAVLQNLSTLAFAQGTQPVLLKLFETGPEAVKAEVLKFVRQNLRGLAMDKAGSMVLQKWMLLAPAASTSLTTASTTSGPIRAVVKAELEGNTKLAEELRGDFFGRFVVQIAEQGQVTSSTASSSSRGRGGASSRGGRGGGSHSAGSRGAGAGRGAGGRGAGGRGAGGRGAGGRGAGRGGARH